MERFIRRNLWLLSGAVILIAAPVAARTMDLFEDFELTRFISGLAPERAATHSRIVIERERIIGPVNSPPTCGDEEKPRHTEHVPATPSVSGDTTPRGEVRAMGEHAYEVPSAEVHDAFANLEFLATQARVVPAFRDGNAQGLKLFAIRPDSLYARLGLRNGDIIRRVNGQSLRTPQSAMAAFESLREARHVEVDLERDGAVLHKVYDVH